MRYNYDCTLVIKQEIFKPFNSLQIKVVCRLVKKDNVRVTEQCLCQRTLTFSLPPRSAICEYIILSSSPRPCINFDALESASQPSISANSASSSAAFIPSSSEKSSFSYNASFFFHNIIKTLVTHNNRIKYSVLVICKVVLFQNRHTTIWVDRHFTGCRIKFTRKNF